VHVLAVDDDPIVLAACRRVLEPAGYSLAVAANVPEALAALGRGPIALVLADLKMPGYDGLQFLTTVQQSRPALPVIVMSGYATTDTEAECLRRGARAFVPKPFSPEELLSAVRRQIGPAEGG
jgi:CheY-like chemotaxis protein